jgi:hypothetical protein
MAEATPQQQHENDTSKTKQSSGPIWRWMVANRWLVTITFVAFVGAVIWGLVQFWLCKHAISPNQCVDAEGRVDFARFHIPLKVVVVIVAGIFGWFLDIFTGEATERKVYHMVAFCYVFPFAVLAGILVPLFAYPDALPDPPKPVGLILGCNERPIFPIDKDLVPEDIRCFNRSDQWLVNIGGHAELMRDPVRLEREAKAVAAAEAVRDAQGLAARKTEGKAEEQGKGKTQETAKPQPNVNAEEEAKLQQEGTAEKKAGRRDLPRYIVTGGLVVPLYFAIIAIFGGFVSMLRRVPEYQEGVSLEKDAPGYLSYARAREKLVFEALQLIAAPLIAITAYYIVDPSSRATSIALAFIAGFSSETVLMYIRALADKIQPSTTRTASDVEVKPTSLTFARQAVGTESAPQTVRLTNRSSTALSGTVTVPPEFACTPSDFNVPAGSSVSFAVTFKPTTAGEKSSDLQIKHNAPGPARVVHLSGEAQ